MVGRLISELKQTKPFRTRADEAYLNLVRTADLLKHDVADFLKPFGLTPTQYNVLRILRGAGGAPKTCGEVSERLVTAEPDVTRLLDRIERQGLLERERSASDRRVVRSRITAKGLDLLATIDQGIDAHQARRLGRLGSERLTQLIDILEELRA
jgi:DNA-binding MarR family transcriptional regulator